MRLLLLFVLLLALTLPALAQEAAGDTTRSYRFELADGSLLFGQIVEETETTITVRLEGGGLLTIERAQIRRMTPVERSAGGRLFEPDPNRNRLLFAPTGRPIRKGGAYVANYYLIFNFIGYGATDRLTLAGGFTLIPGVSPLDQLFYVAPKLTVVSSERLNVAAGFIAGTAALTQQDDLVVGGILYGVVTTGSERRALTFGGGVPFARSGDESFFGNAGILMVGFENQLSRRTKLVSENWLLFGEGIEDPSETILLSGALRYYTNRFSIDVGGIVPTGLLGETSLPLIPYLDASYHFGKR